MGNNGKKFSLAPGILLISGLYGGDNVLDVQKFFSDLRCSGP